METQRLLGNLRDKSLYLIRLIKNYGFVDTQPQYIDLCWLDEYDFSFEFKFSPEILENRTTSFNISVSNPYMPMNLSILIYDFLVFLSGKYNLSLEKAPKFIDESFSGKIYLDKKWPMNKKSNFDKICNHNCCRFSEKFLLQLSDDQQKFIEKTISEYKEQKKSSVINCCFLELLASCPFMENISFADQENRYKIKSKFQHTLSTVFLVESNQGQEYIVKLGECLNLKGDIVPFQMSPIKVLVNGLDIDSTAVLYEKLEEIDDKPNLKKMAQDILQHLIKIHSEMYIHHDIKPQNICIKNGNYVLIDFDDVGIDIRKVSTTKYSCINPKLFELIDCISPLSDLIELGYIHSTKFSVTKNVETRVLTLR